MQPIPEELRYIKPKDLPNGWNEHPNHVFDVAFNEEKNQGTATSGPISHNNTLEKEGELSKVDKPCGFTKPGESGAEYSEYYNSKLEVT